MDLTQAIENIHKCIVQICFLASDLPEEVRRREGRPFISRILGTGFFVRSTGHVVTALHVIRGGRRMAERISAARKDILVGIAQPNTENMRGNFTVVDFEVVAEDDLHDLALLKLSRNPFEGEVSSGIRIGDQEVPLLYDTPSFNPERPKDGTAIGISGYPLGQPVLVTNAGWMATSWAFNIAQLPVPEAPQWFREIRVADAYLADVEVNPGNSGAPVYLVDNGSVIGVCVASKPAPIRNSDGKSVLIDDKQLFYSSGLTIVVPTRYVIELLKEHDL